MLSMNIADLQQAYRSGGMSPHQFIDQILALIESTPDHHVFITRLTREQVMAYVDALPASPTPDQPLYGVPFVIKDNIDLAGVPTTAACPEFLYVPTESATVVQKLINAGAIPLGKTNLDQFATGLVGVRSPYGAGQNSFNREYVSGGSSSGSALAVALGFASFSLGTDTAGSGRVPAAFNNLVGLKPSCGRLSNRGLLPACRSLDCISIFALNASDAQTVLRAAEGIDPLDAWSRAPATVAASGKLMRASVRIGIPMVHQLQFFGDDEYARLYRETCETLTTELGAELVELDFSPLFDAARLLYEGPWVAERYAGIEEFVTTRPDAMHPVTRDITLQAVGKTAIDTFKAQYRMKDFKRLADALLAEVDMLMTPTAGTIYRIADVLADPVKLNSNLGYYTNFMNLLDLAAVAAPAGFRRDGLPFGVTLFAARDADEALLSWAGRVQRARTASAGAIQQALPAQEQQVPLLPEFLPIAVCGAHMEGLPLNPQLTSRHAYLLRRTLTAPAYRFFALPGGPPFRPGLVQVAAQGCAIDVEVWALHQSQWGTFMKGIPSPLALGQVQLDDGTSVTGFLCEQAAVAGAHDISSLGGWRAYLSSLA